MLTMFHLNRSVKSEKVWERLMHTWSWVKTPSWRPLLPKQILNQLKVMLIMKRERKDGKPTQTLRRFSKNSQETPTLFSLMVTWVTLSIFLILKLDLLQLKLVWSPHKMSLSQLEQQDSTQSKPVSSKPSKSKQKLLRLKLKLSLPNRLFLLERRSTVPKLPFLINSRFIHLNTKCMFLKYFKMEQFLMLKLWISQMMLFLLFSKKVARFKLLCLLVSVYHQPLQPHILFCRVSRTWLLSVLWQDILSHKVKLYLTQRRTPQLLELRPQVQRLPKLQLRRRKKKRLTSIWAVSSEEMTTSTETWARKHKIADFER